jgi:hypothetical protein
VRPNPVELFKISLPKPEAGKDAAKDAGKEAAKPS